MIGLIVIVLVFVGAALTVVGVALRSGRKPDAKARKRSQPVVFAGVGVITLAFGFGVPAAVIAYNNHTESRRATGGVTLSAKEANGRELFAAHCATCHQLAAANAIASVGPNLDMIIPPIAEQKARVAFIEDAVTNGRARGNGQMPRAIVDGPDEADVAAFVAKTAGR